MSGRRNGVLALFEAARRAHEWRTAASDEHGALSYLQLDDASDAFARGLGGFGLQPEDRVAIHLPRGADVLVAMLGILKAGAAYVPIDAGYPASRRDQMVRASGARLVVTIPTGSDRAGVPAVAVADVLAGGGSPPEAPPAEPDPHRAACVLFTSGSSGMPKPTLLEHGNLAYLAANPGLPALVPTDRVAQVSSVSFDAFHYEVWCGLAAGAEIVVLPALPDLLANDLQRELRRHRITVMLAPTMAVNHLVREDRDAFASLRILLTGGDVILPATCRDLLAGAFAGEFYNLYGPTEATTACTAHRIRDVAPEDDTVPIGAPLSGAAIHLLDEHQEPVPDGTVGELYIGGDGVAREYLGQPARTREVFLPDPFRPGGRMYATGDRARRRPDGLLEFVGRVDDQVKIRGYRVDSREVERVLLRHDAVRDAAVLAVGEVDGHHLVALVDPRDSLAPDRLRGYAAEHLPDYAVPSAFLVVDGIPATANGKRDLAALRDLAREELRRRHGLVAPRDDVERYLAGVWTELLSVERVGATDDFFALGGNSLLAFRARQRIRRELAVDLEMHEVLTCSVLADLAEVLRERKGSLVA